MGILEPNKYVSGLVKINQLHNTYAEQLFAQYVELHYPYKHSQRTGVTASHVSHPFTYHGWLQTHDIASAGKQYNHQLSCGGSVLRTI